MSQRFCLFYAGFAASAPSVYFNKMALFDQYLPLQNNIVQNEKFSNDLQYLRYENETSIRTAISIADYFKLSVLPEPVDSEEYFKWLKHYISVFEEQFPLTQIDHYYFLYARKIAEFLAHASLVSALADIALLSNDTVNLFYEIDKHLSELETVVFKTMAAAALLSSEPRHGYFRTFYAEVTTAFEKFKIVHASDLDKNGLKALQKDIEEFKYLILNGFKRCITLLKELEI